MCYKDVQSQVFLKANSVVSKQDVQFSKIFYAKL